MALPALLGAAFFGSIITKVIDFFIELFTKKFLIAAALIVAVTALYVAVVAALNAVIASIPYDQVPTILQNGFSMLPSNTDDCIAIIVSTKVAVAAYRFQRNAINIRASS